MKNIQDQLIYDILRDTHKIPFENILGIYPFGSITYGTVTERSDHDFVVIVDMDVDYIQHESEMIDAHIMSLRRYKKMLADHDIMALETYFNPMAIKRVDTQFELNLPELRKKISAIVSNSWVKAKKKVTLENEDSWSGYKSLFHSMRILDFGIQLAETGRIGDFQRVTHLWYEILEKVSSGEDFIKIMEHFKPYQNSRATYFRQLAPKE